MLPEVLTVRAEDESRDPYRQDWGKYFSSTDLQFDKNIYLSKLYLAKKIDAEVCINQDDFACDLQLLIRQTFLLWVFLCELVSYF